MVLIAPGRYELVPATLGVQELKRIFGKHSNTVSIDDMNKA